MTSMLSRTAFHALSLSLMAASFFMNALVTQAQSIYTLTSLGQIAPEALFPQLKINSRGEIIGQALDSNKPRAAVWQNGKWMFLPSLPSLPASTTNYTTGINDKGQIVGYSRSLDDHSFQACLWNGHKVQAISIPGRKNSMALSINEKGQVLVRASNVGFVDLDLHPAYFLWTKGKIEPLQIPLDPICVNDTGQILLNNRDAAIWKSGHVISLDGFPKGRESRGVAINAHNVVVGEAIVTLGVVSGQTYPTSPGTFVPPAEPYDNSRACLWQNGTITNLGVLPGSQVSIALGLNDLGDAVGDSGPGDSDSFAALPTRATLWSHHSIIDLQGCTIGLPKDPNGHDTWRFERATGINNHGQIVGIGYLRSNNGASHTTGFLLTPTSPSGKH